MERMGDILAKAAVRRAGGLRRKTTTATTTARETTTTTTTPTMPSPSPSPQAARPHMPHSPAVTRAAPTPRAMRPPAMGADVAEVPTPRELRATRFAPPADALDSDRILELPTRGAIVSAAPAAPRQRLVAASAPVRATFSISHTAGQSPQFERPHASERLRTTAGGADGDIAAPLRSGRAITPPDAASSQQQYPQQHGATLGSTARNGRRAAGGGMLSLHEGATAYMGALEPRRRASQPAADTVHTGNDWNADAGQADSLERPADARGTRQRASAAKASAKAAEMSLARDVCPFCRGAGYVRLDVPVGDPSFGQATPCACKEQQLEERHRSDLRRLSSLDPVKDKSLATFEDALPGVREAFEVARRFADDPQGWLVLSGGYGTGKTHLAAAIANQQLAVGCPVFFSIVPDLLDHLRAAYAPSSEIAYDELFDKVREAGLLVLDDLGAENGTAWATEKLFQIINYRYNFRMPTVITTNNRLLSHMDERIRSRLSDLSLVRHVVIESADYRERHAGRRPPHGAAGGTSGGRGRR
ncbi:MAG: ATP-binding protein [Ktedonobacterales bacterium]